MSDNLNRLRFAKYMQKIPTSPVLPEKLPPTERAAFYHTLRVHLRVMQWTALNTSITEATDWGWKLEGRQLVPIPTDLEPARADLLKVISCNSVLTTERHLTFVAVDLNRLPEYVRTLTFVALLTSNRN